MTMEENDVIEVEVLSETTEEKEVAKEPKKNVTYVSKGDKGAKYLAVSLWISRFIVPAIFFFGAAGLTFSILHSQGPNLFRLVVMLFMWSACALCFVTGIVGFFLGKHGHNLIAKDKERK